MIDAVNAGLIAKKAINLNGYLKMLYQKIYSAAACGHDHVSVLLDGGEVKFVEEFLAECGYTTKIVSGLPSSGCVILDLGWEF